jgi:glycosyltransferase involved in cell wall biosynthesis
MEFPRMLERESGGKPFLTIGVPTFNRHELLRETLNSIITQGFTDFEVIVGNDYTAELLTGEMIGISDPRIRFVNHPENLQEVGNMNALLDMATGRYFTWIFDDDLYEPDFLQTAHDCLAETGFPPVIFSSFRTIIGDEEFRPQKIQHKPMSEFTGREFLRWYSAFRPKLYPTYGLFDTVALKRLGGFDELSKMTYGMYSEHLLLVKSALLDRVVFIDAPFYIYRQHIGSWSESNTELEKYVAAGKELIRRSNEVLSRPPLADDHDENLLKICTLHLIEFAFKSGQHIKYLPEHAQREIGIKTISRAISRHWDESSKTRKLYLSLCGNISFRNWLLLWKTILFCNYLILCHFYKYYRKRKA